MVNGIVTKSKRGRRQRRETSTADHVGKYASDAFSLAKRTAAGLNEIRKLINIETKARDNNIVSYAQGTTATLTAMTGIDQGLDYNQRVGDSIKLQRLTVRGRVNVNPAATNSLVRIMVVRDLAQNGTAPVSGDVLQVSGSVGAPLSNVLWINKDRFSILYDELFALSSILSSGDATIPFEYLATHAGHVRYLSTTAAAASNGLGSIYVLSVSDEGTNTPSIAFSTRVEYTDD